MAVNDSQEPLPDLLSEEKHFYIDKYIFIFLTWLEEIFLPLGNLSGSVALSSLKCDLKPSKYASQLSELNEAVIFLVLILSEIQLTI